MKIDDKKMPGSNLAKVFLPGVDYERIVMKQWQTS